MLSPRFQITLLGLLASSALCLGLSMPSIFSDRLVLESGQAELWGWDDPGATVTASFRGKTAQATCDDEGRWSLSLPTDEPGPGGDLIVEGTSRQVCRDALVGEVWLAAGQSNMVMGLRRSIGGDEAARTTDLPNVRFFNVPFNQADETDKIGAGRWEDVTPDTAPGLSAVAYYFARSYAGSTGTPLGIIRCARGGSSAQSWISPQTYTGDPALADFRAAWERHTEKVKTQAMPRYELQYANWQKKAEAAKAAGKNPPREPTSPMNSLDLHRASVFWHGMLEPILPYTVKGVLWYQGESNAQFGEHYETLLTALIADWRQYKGTPTPFIVVQLPDFGGGNFNGDVYAQVREGQAAAARKDDKTALLVTMGWGDPKDIHPICKQPVGEGLAGIALGLQSDGILPEKCPAVTSIETEPGKLVVHFSPVSGQLQSNTDGETIQGFKVAGANGVYYPAQAKVTAPDTIELSSADVTEPTYATYGWANYPEPMPNMVDADGWRPSPFRWQKGMP